MICLQNSEISCSQSTWVDVCSVSIPSKYPLLYYVSRSSLKFTPGIYVLQMQPGLFPQLHCIKSISQHVKQVRLSLSKATDNLCLLQEVAQLFCNLKSLEIQFNKIRNVINLADVLSCFGEKCNHFQFQFNSCTVQPVCEDMNLLSKIPILANKRFHAKYKRHTHKRRIISIWL